MERGFAASYDRRSQLNFGVRPPTGWLMQASTVFRRALWITALLTGLSACRQGPLPVPDELPLGTFVIDLEGVAYVGGDTVHIAERVRGTACLRLGNAVLLDSRDLSRRRFLFFFPNIPAPTGRRTVAFKWPESPDVFEADGHLNHGPLMHRGVSSSLHVISGSADLSAASSADIRGELRARLAEPVLIGDGIDAVTVVDTTTTRALMTLRGSFRADTGRGEQCEFRRWWELRRRK
jgi:hypothetical protein